MCGRKNGGAGACAAHFQNVCNVRAGVDENPRTLKVWGKLVTTFKVSNQISQAVLAVDLHSKQSTSCSKKF